MAVPRREQLSDDHRWGEQVSVAEGADQRPGWVVVAEPLPVAQRRAGEQVQCVSEHAGLRRRADQQLAVDRGAALHGPLVEPLRMPLAVSYTHLTLPTKRIV